MGSKEIRLRKNKLSPGKIARHRNYDELIRRHRRGLKTKQLLLVVIYIVVVLLLILLSFIAIRLEKKREGKTSNISTTQNISVSTQLPLPWSDDRLRSASHNSKT